MWPVRQMVPDPNLIVDRGRLPRNATPRSHVPGTGPHARKRPDRSVGRYNRNTHELCRTCIHPGVQSPPALEPGSGDEGGDLRRRDTVVSVGEVSSTSIFVLSSTGASLMQHASMQRQAPGGSHHPGSQPGTPLVPRPLAGVMSPRAPARVLAVKVRHRRRCTPMPARTSRHCWITFRPIPVSSPFPRP